MRDFVARSEHAKHEQDQGRQSSHAFIAGEFQRLKLGSEDPQTPVEQWL
jgi:hypothetical protein